jgi:hypothetical protein
MYQGTKIAFSGNAGIREEFCTVIDTLSFFVHFATVIRNIEKINGYAQQNTDSHIPKSRSPMRNCEPITVQEMYLYVALLTLMEIVQKPAIRSYVKRGSFIETPTFP